MMTGLGLEKAGSYTASGQGDGTIEFPIYSGRGFDVWPTWSGTYGVKKGGVNLGWFNLSEVPDIIGK